MNRLHRKIGPAVIAVSLVLVLGACSGSSDSTSSPDTTTTPAGAAEDTDGDSDATAPVAVDAVDTCALLTREDVESVMGGEFEDGDGGGVGSCAYNAVSEDVSLRQAQVMFTPIVQLQSTPFDEFVDMAAEPLDNTDITPVDGLGKAALLTSGGMMTLLFVETETGVVAIGVMGADDEAATAKELAEIAIGNL